MRRQNQRSTKPLWFAIGALALLVIWDPFSTQPVPEFPMERKKQQADPEIPQLRERIEILESELQQELIQRLNLEQRLSRLENRAVSGGEPAELSSDENGIAGTTRVRRDGTRDSNLDPASAQTSSTAPSLQEKLISAGLPEETVFAIKNTLDRNRLEMLELRNSAVRDGWQETPEYVEKMHELRDSSRGLREEFGDQTYDQYLYASGQPNRIVVREVYQGSAAATAGIQAGDIITGYAAERLFSMSDLRQATVEGTAGESVVVEIMRDGEPLITSIVRGPMGISMNATSAPPQQP